MTIRTVTITYDDVDTNDPGHIVSDDPQLQPTSVVLVNEKHVTMLNPGELSAYDTLLAVKTVAEQIMDQVEQVKYADTLSKMLGLKTIDEV